MFKNFIGIFSFLIVLYFFSDSFLGVSQRRDLLNFISLLAIVAIFLAPSISAEQRRKKEKLNISPAVLDAPSSEGEFHNDFQRVGSADDYQDVHRINAIKPIDYSGDAIAAGKREILEEISHLDIEEKNKK